MAAPRDPARRALRADLQDFAVQSLAATRDALARDLHRRRLAWTMLGDGRNLVTTLVGGRTQCKRRGDDSGAPEATNGPIEHGAAAA